MYGVVAIFALVLRPRRLTRVRARRAKARPRSLASAKPNNLTRAFRLA